jgi:hypothetical protein
MEDALISPAGFMILSGAGLIEGEDSAKGKIPVHVAEQTDEVYVINNKAYVIVNQELSNHKESDIYVMVMKDGEVVTEPYLGTKATAAPTAGSTETTTVLKEAFDLGRLVIIDAITDTELDVPGVTITEGTTTKVQEQAYDPDKGMGEFSNGTIVMVDYYTDKGAGTQQIDITPDKFGGNYYLEASTLFRDTNGVDMPAEFIIPNCKIQSNFTFTMASSGDPSTFTFTMDAFPDYTRFNKTKKVLAAIQIVSGNSGATALYREETPSNHVADANGIIVQK